jgi:TM2 domain-containing membrane protein YozV
MTQPQPDPSRHQQPGHPWLGHAQPGPLAQEAAAHAPPGNGMVPYAPAGYPAYNPGPRVSPRGRAVGAVVSIFLPGIGSMINGSVGRGSIILISYIIACVLCLVLIGFILAPAVWIWGVIDGARSADRWNRRHGIIS